MTRTSAEVIADARATREAEEALALRRDELGETGYLQAMRRLVGPERYVDWIEGMYLGRYGRGSSRCGGAEKGQQMAAAKKQEGASTLRMKARLLDVKSKAPTIRRTGYSGDGPEELKGGSLVVTLEVERPQLPELPKKPYQIDGRSRPKDPGAEPVYVAPEKQEGETAAAFKARAKSAEAAHGRAHATWKQASDDVARYDRYQAEYQAALDRHTEQAATLTEALRSYAELFVAGGLMAGMEWLVTMRPSQSQVKKFLPGFMPSLAFGTSPALLGAGAQGPETELEEAAG